MVTDRVSGFRSLLTFVVVRERLPRAVCHRSAWRCATPCYSLSEMNAFNMIVTSSTELRETLVPLVPWPWAVLVSTCALPRFDGVLREQTIVLFFCDTMFGEMFLMSGWYVVSSLQNRTSSKIWVGRKSSNLAQYVDGPCAVLVPTVLHLCCRDLIKN